MAEESRGRGWEKEDKRKAAQWGPLDEFLYVPLNLREFI